MKLIAKYAVAACVAGFGMSVPAQASSFFQIDSTPGGTKLFLNNVKNSATSTGTVINTDDVGISVIGNSDFANGWSNIKPIKDGSLTSLTFTPVNGNAFGGFSFRGQVLSANQLLTVTVQDNQGDLAESFNFTIPNANADFGRLGIISNTLGKTIQYVTLYSAGGFKEGKQFAFTKALDDGGGGTGSDVPEPASWMMMILGMGLVGVGMRRRAHNISVTA
jgi:hypothetical protein